MNLERLSRTTVDAGVTVPLLHRFSRSLPRNPVPDPPPRVGGVALPFTLAPAVDTPALLQLTSLDMDGTLAAGA